MADGENYYEALEVVPEASAEEIRHAYRSKVVALHPDRLHGVADEVRLLAEEKLKEINRANDVLSDPSKRREYDAEWLKRYSPPRPEVEPAHIRFDEVTPSQRQAGSFVISNAGGPFDNIRVSDPESWVRVTGYRSLTDQEELPLRVDIEAEGRKWGRTYEETISVTLDDQETQVRVRLRTRSSPTVFASIGPRRRTRGKPQGLPLFGRITRQSRPSGPSRARALDERALDGAGAGMRWGGGLGAIASAVIGVLLVFQMGEPLFTTGLLAPAFGILFGAVEAVGGVIVGGIVGVVAGLAYGALRKS